MTYKGQTNTLALPDHKNRIQVTFTPDFGTNKKLSNADQEHPQARPVDPADQPHQPDPRAGRPDRAQQVRDPDAHGLTGRSPAPAVSATSRLFRFVQVELPWPLGPPDGRYLLRPPEPTRRRRRRTCSCSPPSARPSAGGWPRCASSATPHPSPSPRR